MDCGLYSPVKMSDAVGAVVLLMDRNGEVMMTVYDEKRIKSVPVYYPRDSVCGMFEAIPKGW